MEHYAQIIAAAVLLGIFYVYIARAYVLMLVVNFWPVVLLVAVGLAIIIVVRLRR